MRVNDTYVVTCLLDTGTLWSVIGDTLCTRLNADRKLLKQPIQCTSEFIHGKPVLCAEIATLTLALETSTQDQSHSFPDVEFIVLPNLPSMLLVLGHKFLVRYGIDVQHLLTTQAKSGSTGIVSEERENFTARIESTDAYHDSPTAIQSPQNLNSIPALHQAREMSSKISPDVQYEQSPRIQHQQLQPPRSKSHVSSTHALFPKHYQLPCF